MNGPTLGDANLETHFLAHLFGYNSRPWVRPLNR